MSDWLLVLGELHCTVETDGAAWRLPIGWAALAGEVLTDDPPRAEQLTNAIGAVVDHLDDVVRDRPDAIGADWSVAGPLAVAIAAVELGRDVTLPIDVGRDAVEEVFRTVATEPAIDRRHNPGLAADLVPAIVAACCIAVGVMRRLHLDRITVVAIDQDARS